MSLFAIFFRERKDRGWGGVRRKVSTGCAADSSKLGSVLPFSDLWSLFYTRFKNLLLDTKPWQIRFGCIEWYLISFCVRGCNEIKCQCFQQFCDSLPYTQYSFSLQKERKGAKANLYSLAHNGELMFSLRQLPWSVFDRHRLSFTLLIKCSTIGIRFSWNRNKFW